MANPWDVIFIPSYEEHQFKNIGHEPVEFLCTKETGKTLADLKRSN